MGSRAIFSKSEILKNQVKAAEVLSRLEDLFEIVPPDELRDTILEIYQVYIIREHKEGLPGNFDEMAEHLYLLLRFLKKIQQLTDVEDV